MSSLNTEPNFHRAGETALQPWEPGDSFYEALIAAHLGLDDAQSQLLNARLLLVLANHIGDLSVLEQAIAAARGGLLDGMGAVPHAEALPPGSPGAGPG
jgi:hypothetical protein